MELLSMGGYGAYVWTAYALMFGGVILCVAQGRRRHQRVFDELRTRLKVSAERNK
jgi:heme exporter protein CcmD